MVFQFADGGSIVGLLLAAKLLFDKREDWRQRTFTIVSAYFITHDTKRPVQLRFSTTSHVTKS
jgi:hypothetical protein